MSDEDPEGLTNTKQSDPLATFNTKRRRGVRVTSAAAIALGLALAGGAVAGATTSSTPSTSSGPSAADHRPPMGGSPPAAVGTVASVGAGTFTLTTQDNTTVTVNVGTTTTYRDAGVTAPTLANVTVGEHVAVFGTDTANVVTGTSVAIGDPPGGGPGGHGPGGSPPAAVGTVASVGTGTFTLTTQDNTTVTVNVGTTTTYRDAGVTTPTLANVTVGEHVAVFGTDTANVVTATGVAIGDPPSGGPGGRGPGGPGGPEGQDGPPPSGGGNGSTSTSTSG
jgi:endonuclease YncB( thermonuclease family)